MMSEAPIVIKELADLGVELPAWGRFAHRELVYALALLPDGRGRAWSREPNESAELFSARVVRDIVERLQIGCRAVLTG
jgi:hypothetical protein